MALDYRKCAENIFSHLGGRQNLVSAAHCATRLRLVIADNSKVDMKALEDVEGVKGVFSNNGQLQLIIGTGTVNKVYDEFLAVTGLSAATKEDVKAAAAARQPLPKRLIKALGDVFVPILPAIVSSGLLMGLVEALGKAIPGFADSSWYGFLDLVSSTAFAYLPVLIAVSAAKVFGGNIFLGGVIGLCMINSSLTNAWAAGTAENIGVWNLLFFNVKQVGYQGHVIPVIIAVFLMCKIERWLHKHVPEVIDLFVTPLVSVFVTAFLTFTIIGPIFSTAENYILEFAKWLITVGYGVGAFCMGALYPLTVVTGLHHMYNMIEAGLLSAPGGMNIWMPIASAANFAQCGACLAVAIKAKNTKTRAIAVPSALSAALGITEPAIFGVNLRFVKPLICGIIGGAVGAMFGSIMHIGANAYGVTGIPGFLIIDSSKILAYAIMLLISGGIAFTLTLFVWKEEKAEVNEAPKLDEATEAPAAFICAPKTVYAPVEGTSISYEKIPDETFASGCLGQGVGIEPTLNEVVAPFDGEISSVTDTKHALGITSADGMELLIHVGVNTVNMDGDGFEMFCKEGDTVKAGQKLITFDIDKIKKAGYDTTVAVLVTNSDDYEAVSLNAGACKELDTVITVK